MATVTGTSQFHRDKLLFTGATGGHLFI